MENIKKYVDELFKEAPKTKKVKELQEELIINLEEKYNDLVKDGVDEKKAYNDVISGIGDIDELIADFKEPLKADERNTMRKRTALVVSISVGLYILCLIAVIVLSEFNVADYLIACAFFSIAGVSTCILVYHFLSLPKYKKIDETLVEEFKEWKHQKSKCNELKKSILSILWTLTIVIYVLISFIYNCFYISWVIFLVAAIIDNIIELIFKMRDCGR